MRFFGWIACVERGEELGFSVSMGGSFFAFFAFSIGSVCSSFLIDVC